MAKIIDQKGRLFGLINVIDLSVILILVSFVPLIFIGYKIVSMGEKTEDKEWVSVKIKLVETEPEFSSIISAGDVEKDPLGKTIGRLTAIANVKPSKVWVTVDNKMLTTIDHPVKKDIVVNADILCLKKEGTLYYKAIPVKVGNAITFTTDLYNLPGLVVGLERDKTLDINE
ncbi:MAG: DUF4330 family protein [Candidatus Omnitrophica bacterium]|nr:DUF4330 family protein [Candidatus Omnitrophota bacterium]MDD5435943.1 DUF4330 family protein [Candidatus Omnitrophota bacterium]